MKIIVENSTWRNLGDGFYQSALYALIKQLFPFSEVYMGEGPVERSFQPNKRQIKNAFKMIDFQRADLHLFSGPIIRQLLTNYKTAIINLTNRGEKYGLISCTAAGISQEMLHETLCFIEKYPPYLFSTRDEFTYNLFKNYVPSSYNGICTAFLVDRFLPIDTLDIGEKFFVSSFYRTPEPIFTLKGNACVIEDIELQKRSLMYSLPWRFSRHLEINRRVPIYLADKKILRLIQGISNKSNYYNFAYPNSYIAINPVTYLSAFKGAEFTISDRVHACAVTLAFGKPARLTWANDRCGIFDRMGFDYRTNDGLMYPDLTKIDDEIKKLSNYLTQTIKH